MTSQGHHADKHGRWRWILGATTLPKKAEQAHELRVFIYAVGMLKYQNFKPLICECKEKWLP